MNKPHQHEYARETRVKQEKVANDRSHLFRQLAYMSNLSNMNINVNTLFWNPYNSIATPSNFSSHNRRRKMCHLSTNPENYVFFSRNRCWIHRNIYCWLYVKTVNGIKFISDFDTRYIECSARTVYFVNGINSGHKCYLLLSIDSCC